MISRYKSGPLSTNPAGQLQVFRHDRDALCVNCEQVRVFKEPDEICLCCFLQCQDRCGLESQVLLEILCDLPDKPLEWQLSDQQARVVLVTTDFPERHAAGPAVRINVSKGTERNYSRTMKCAIACTDSGVSFGPHAMRWSKPSWPSSPVAFEEPYLQWTSATFAWFWPCLV
jgi:hypothetical protein